MTNEQTASQSRPNIHQWDGEAFRQEILSIRNTVVPDQTLESFDADKNFIGQGIAGQIDGAGQRFPRAADKTGLLDYALEKAKQAQDSHDAALILSTAVVTVHPFLDGNGRTSRALYRNLVNDEPVTAAQPVAGPQDNAAREEIDLGSVWDDSGVKQLREQYIWHLAGLDFQKLWPYRVSVYLGQDGLTELEQVELDAAERAGLDDERVTDLKSAIGADEHGNTYGTDSSGLRFAFFAAVPSAEQTPYLENREIGGQQIKILRLHNYLANASPDQKAGFVDKLWEYRRLCAQASIDVLSDDIGGQAWLKNQDGTQIAVRDYVVERSNNFKNQPSVPSETLTT